MNGSARTWSTPASRKASMAHFAACFHGRGTGHAPADLIAQNTKVLFKEGRLGDLLQNGF